MVTAVLLGASALAFTAGSAAERSSHHESTLEHAAATSTATASPAVSSAPGPASVAPIPAAGLGAPEGSAEREAAEHGRSSIPTPAISAAPVPPARTNTAAAAAPEGSAAREAAERAGAAQAGERLLGINTESAPVVALADIASLALLILVLVVPSGLALGVVAALTVAFSAAATALDVREALHQHDLGRPGLMSAAVGVAGLHLLCALAAGALVTRGQIHRLRSEA